MGLVIAILAMLLVLGSFLWMRPSPRDQFLSKLRSQALMSGFRISSLKLPDMSESGRINHHQEIITIYVKTLAVVKQTSIPYTVMRTTGEAGIYLPGGWDWHNRRDLSEPLMKSIGHFVASLPISVSVVTVDQSQASISWDEKDPSINFQRLSTWLSTAAGLINRKIHGE